MGATVIMYYAKIMPCDDLNGEGFRTVMFVSGCTMNCPHCHNPDAQNFRFGHEYTSETEEYIFECLDHDYIKGLTLTGGHPLERKNYPVIKDLCEKIRDKYNGSKDIWLYSGYTLEEIHGSEYSGILCLVDVLVDGRYEHELQGSSLLYRGSSNQRILYKGKDF